VLSGGAALIALRARKELGYAGEIWEPSYHDRRARDVEEYFNFREYIRQNPVKRGLAKVPEEFPYSSAYPGFVMDAVPDRLKAKFLNAI
jgi:hypothetical protein